MWCLLLQETPLLLGSAPEQPMFLAEPRSPGNLLIVAGICKARCLFFLSHHSRQLRRGHREVSAKLLLFFYTIGAVLCCSSLRILAFFALYFISGGKNLVWSWRFRRRRRVDHYLKENLSSHHHAGNNNKE